MFDDNASAQSGLSTGAKVAILAAIPFIVLGVFYLLTPITDLRTHTGGVFGCGTALGGAGDQFKSNICGDINTVYMYKGLLAILAGILVSVAGVTLFGKGSSTEETTNSNSGGVQAPRTSATFSDDLEPAPSSTGTRGRARTFD